MAMSRLIPAAALLCLCGLPVLKAQGAGGLKPGLRSTGNSELEVVPARTDDLCRSRAGAVEIGELSADAGRVKVSGSWKASPGTERLVVEVRIDQDRQAMNLYEGAAGSWSANVPFALCGKHMMRVYAFATVPDGGRTALCFEGAPSAAKGFEIVCTPQAWLDRCVVDCPKAKPATSKVGKGRPAAPAECKATCEASASGGVGTLAGLVGVNDANYRLVDGPGSGPWTFTVTCKPGDKVSFLARDHSGTGASSKPAEKECAPQ